MTVTGAMADHRLRLRGGDVAGLRRRRSARCSRAARHVGARPGRRRSGTAPGCGTRSGWSRWRADLEKNRGRSLVIAGRRQPAAVHALAAALNAALGNVGATVEYGVARSPPMPRRAVEALRALVDEIAAGTVDTLVVTAENPVYTAPGRLQAGAAACKRVPNVVYHGLYEDETAQTCNYVRPRGARARVVGRRARHRRHGLDRAAADRAALGRLHRGRGAGGVPGRGRERRRTRSCSSYWSSMSKLLRQPGRLRSTASGSSGWPTASSPTRAASSEQGLTINARRAGPGGRAAARARRGGRRAWRSPSRRSQDLRRSLRQQRLAAGAAAPDHQADLGQRGDALAGDGRPAGHRDRRRRRDHQPRSDARGAGDDRPRPRRRRGHAAARLRAPRHGPCRPRVGFDAGALRTSDAPWFDRGAEVANTGRHHRLAITQDHWTMSPDGREIPPPAVRRTDRRGAQRGLDVPRGARGAARAAADHPPALVDYSKAAVQVGHGDRPQQVHGLQRLRRRLPVGEQHPGRRQGQRLARAARCTGSASTATSAARSTSPR